MPSKKILLVDPIYEMQDEETPKQYWFANEYYHFDGTQNEFLDYFYPPEEPSIAPQVAPSGAEIPFKLPATRNTMKNWMKFKQWYKRKKAYWKDFIEDTQNNLKKDIGEFFKEDAKDLIESLKNDWNLDKKIDRAKKVKPHTKAKGKSDLSKAHKEKVETLLTEVGMPKDIAKNDSNLTVDAEITTKKEDYLFVDELSDYNLDDVLSEVTEDVDDEDTSDNG